MVYIAVHHVSANGRRYAPGEVIEAEPSYMERLLQQGAVKPQGDGAPGAPRPTYIATDSTDSTDCTDDTYNTGDTDGTEDTILNEPPVIDAMDGVSAPTAEAGQKKRRK